jgi:hypothetical protein
MRQGTYLNVILTVNALLLAVLAWTQLAGHGGNGPLVQTAQAQRASDGGMTTAAEQRQRMIESLREVRQSVNETNRLLERGTLRVHVVNSADLRQETSKSPNVQTSK